MNRRWNELISIIQYVSSDFNTDFYSGRRRSWLSIYSWMQLPYRSNSLFSPSLVIFLTRAIQADYHLYFPDSRTCKRDFNEIDFIIPGIKYCRNLNLSKNSYMSSMELTESRHKERQRNPARYFCFFLLFTDAKICHFEGHGKSYYNLINRYLCVRSSVNLSRTSLVNYLLILHTLLAFNTSCVC